MAQYIPDNRSIEEIQKERDRHYYNSNEFFHRMNCTYCYRRMNMMPLPEIEVKVRHPDRDTFEIRKFKDKGDESK